MTTEQYSTAFYGDCVRALQGWIFQIDCRPDRLVSGASTAGSEPGSCARSWRHWRKTWRTVGRVHYPNALSTAPSSWRNRGRQSGQDQAGPRDEAHGFADASGLPRAGHTAAASPQDVTRVEVTLAATVTAGRPRRLIGDRADASDPLDQTLAAQGIELIVPYRCSRTRLPTQDGRPLRRYRRRWKIERLFAWLSKYKRVLNRWDRSSEPYTAFVPLALSMILVRRLQCYL